MVNNFAISFKNSFGIYNKDFQLYSNDLKNWNVKQGVERARRTAST
jgi:hypothetical protein